MIVHRIIVTHPDFLSPEAAKFVIPHGCVFLPQHLLWKNPFVPVISAAVWKSAFLCHSVRTRQYASVHVCTPLWARQSVFVLSESRMLCHAAAQWPRHYRIEKENARKKENSTGVAMSCPFGAHSLGLIGLIHHCMEMDLHPKKRTYILFVCWLFCPDFFQLHFPFPVCALNEMTSLLLLTFRPDCSLAVTNKTCSHDLFPQTSPYWFQTTGSLPHQRETGGGGWNRGLQR